MGTLARCRRRGCLAIVTASVVLGVLMTAPPAAAQDASAVPRGIFSLTPGGAPVSPDALANPLIAGISLRDQWQDVEPTEGTLDWSYFDREIGQARVAGKRVLLRIVAGGRNIPGWVLDAGAQTISFIDPNPYHRTYGMPITIPVFWDEVYLTRKLAFIAAMGQHFAGSLAVDALAVSCANAMTGDWNVPHSDPDIEQWLLAGYTADRLIQACTRTVDAAMTAFPGVPILMAVGQNGALDPTPTYVAEQVIAQARTTYPGRFVVQRNSLSATTPDPRTTDSVGAWHLVLENRPDTGAQMLAAVTGDEGCRMNGKVAPCDPAAVLRQAVEVGGAYGTHYQEISERDLVNPELEGVVRYAADLLSVPTPPGRLRARLRPGPSVRLRWTPSTDEVGVVGYRIYRDGALVGTTARTAYRDRAGLLPGTDHTYEVSAYDAAGNESGRSAARVVKIR